MRSKDDDTPTQERGTPAERFGAFMAEAATAAGYDLGPKGGGRSRLAEDTGLSLSSIGRMLAGRTLPMPKHFATLARAVNRPVRSLFEIAEMETGEESADGLIRPIGSVPLTPEEVADMWGITDPALRPLFISTSEQVRRLQREKDHGGSNGGAVARG
ncbi:XRE family transcriptional regulator [Streptomyces sp. MBT49]|uniref:XRE family transcriptional regulator n=1 Tax=unclassified Streptomyces TaxID=2593676 RepID=UPI00190D7340|nr:MULTISPECIES: XRE family transcriptional regulator [unclassified Streptomyces]MBK3625451.1 XRE family transcriptional regulator [Streptomyces sp. MBT49]MBK3633286.1 XRE family transcriptional regulator [Streptomyces sp. MBT97]